MPPYCITNAPDAAPKPEGGFTFAPVNHLLLACQAQKQDLISTRGLQADCGLLLMKERRHAYAAVAGPGRPAHYGAHELQKLLDTPRLSHAERAIEELTTSGLVPITQTSMDFVTNPDALPDLDRTAYAAMRGHVPATLRHVPFPRPLLRYLACEGSSGLIATTFCVALRCLRYHARERLCTFGGTVPASWIVGMVGLSERSVYRHLATLEHLGVLGTEHRPKWYVHKYGPWRLVNKDWTPPPYTSRARVPRCRTVQARRSRQLELFPLAPTPAADIPTTPALEDSRQSPPLPEREGCKKMAVPSCTNMAVSDLHNASNNVDSRSTPAVKPFQEIIKHQFRKPAPPADPALTAVSTLQDALTSTTAASGVLLNGDRKTGNPPQPTVPWEALEADYAALPDERQSTLREEALTRLLERGDKRDFITKQGILTEICLMLAAANGHGLPVALDAPADPVPVSPSIPACDPPTRPNASCTPVVKAQLPAPTLRHVIIEDLQETGRLLVLLDQSLCEQNAPDRLAFVALAEHALRVGSQNPCGLFATLLGRQCWDFITDADDDAAQARLKAYDYGINRRRTPQPSPAPTQLDALSKDAWVIRELQRECARAGLHGDVFELVHREDPAWTRERWDNAVRELPQAQQTWKQANALSYLVERGTEGDWLAARDPEAGEACQECGEEGQVCACLHAEDDA